MIEMLTESITKGGVILLYLGWIAAGLCVGYIVGKA
jgi:hypothetical protein